MNLYKIECLLSQCPEIFGRQTNAKFILAQFSRFSTSNFNAVNIIESMFIYWQSCAMECRNIDKSTASSRCPGGRGYAGRLPLGDKWMAILQPSLLSSVSIHHSFCFYSSFHFVTSDARIVDRLSFNHRISFSTIYNMFLNFDERARW